MAKTRAKRRAVVKKSRVKKSQVKKSKSRNSASSKPKSTPNGTTDPLFATVKGATHRYLGHVRLDVGRAGDARVKRMIYPPGFRWSKDMKHVVGTDLCMHAHAGFLAHGEIHIEYADGCVVEHKAPPIVAIDPGHDGWGVGEEPVVIIEFDFEGDTVQRLGMPEAHHH
jgi:hypothetical protein